MPERKAKATLESAPCKYCNVQFTFYFTPGEKPTLCCGKPLCLAKSTWERDHWEGAARMADARRRAGIELTEFDHEALRRVS